MAYTKASLRERLKNQIMAGSKGGKPGQWSARKAQLLAQAYKKAGGGYSGLTRKQAVATQVARLLSKSLCQNGLKRSGVLNLVSQAPKVLRLLVNGICLRKPVLH